MINFANEMVMLLSAVCFILGLRFLASPKTARQGNWLGAFGMGLAVLATLSFVPQEVWPAIVMCMALGAVVGVTVALRVQMTAMPQMVALLNGLGGAASVFVPVGEILKSISDPAHMVSTGDLLTSWFSIVVGAVTFSGSLVAFGKLQELLPARAMMLMGHRTLVLLVALLVLAVAPWMLMDSPVLLKFAVLSLASLALGVLLVLPIGGADMPVVISLLNSYSGIAAMAAGFVVQSNLLIIAGALVGASGIILTRIMCQAMNRSLINVVFGAFSKLAESSSGSDEKPMREFTTTDAAMLMQDASLVLIVPGYGLAVSQAQRSIRDLADRLKARQVAVKYGIHPVAGRMPGHMNVLLAEADVPYEELLDLDQANGEFENADVVLVVGANDVVNPAALDDKSSPLYGMPILRADKAKHIIVLKRGRGRGFAGVENPLFTLDKSGVVFGDAKKSIVSILSELSA